MQPTVRPMPTGDPRAGSMRAPRRRSQGRSRSCARGFTYLSLLFAVAILGLALAVVGEVDSTNARRERQEQLRWVGAQFVNAIASYYYSSPGAVKTYPNSFDDLLQDKRFVTTRRHLREVYVDPLTDKVDWTLLPATQSGFRGVATPQTMDAAFAEFAFTPPF